MRNVRVLSKLLFAITRVTAVGYLLAFLLSAIAFATGWSLRLTDNSNRFEICYPFTGKSFLLGEYNSGYIFMFLLLLGLYALFFFLVGNVFQVFTKDRLFTQHAIRHLKWFYTGNLILPSVAALVISPFYPVESPVEILIILHALLGVFTYFMAAIFEQGVDLQNEKDLII